MKSILFISLPAVAMLASAIGCTAAVGEDEATGVNEAAATSCPAASASDDQMRAAATAAFNIMRDAAKVGGMMLLDTSAPSAPSALAPQRYRVQSSGTGIEFDPGDPLYVQVSNQMKADLAIAQLDTTVAKFLSDGLKYAYANTTGLKFPSLRGVGALANYKYPGPSTAHLVDPTSADNSHNATATGTAWCNTSLVTINETVASTWQFSPLWADQITVWRSNVTPLFKGTKVNPWTPFNGAVSTGNPYLLVSVNGKSTSWASYDFSTVSCYANANFTCTGSIQIDPVPYAEPGAYYNTVGIVGTQANPFALTPTTLYAVSDHSAQWATRTTNNVQEWGTFNTPVSVLGVTVYKYVKQM
jgi:hypothetical protein